MKDDLTYLRHILDAIDKIQTYLKAVTYEAFCRDGMMIDAVVRELEIIGEASAHLSEEFQLKHPDVPGEMRLTCAIS